MSNFFSFSEYLSNLSIHGCGNNTSDYGMYLRDISVMRKFADHTSTLMFLIDYKTMSYPFMDDNVRQVLGHPKEAYVEGGLEFSLHQNQNFSLLNKEIFADRNKYLSEVSNDKLPYIRFSMGFGYRDERGSIRKILQRNTITELTTDNFPKGIFGFCWNITDEDSNPKIFHSIEILDRDTREWTTILHKNFFPGIDPEELLGKREIEILKWMSDGLIAKEIAEKLYLSKYTVDTHRKNMLHKTNSKNIAELILYANRLGLI
ncbi:hypothetical protein DYBT9275_05306 [Dyadobacter sp. CECT 9275]|uniref:HTH luxR-type domain-containing protein n=1 Tax=Dyadobacter helix TaxID=2822344 RepID=A0A916JHM6_9BACT|nr:LuxR C-terminal-related transcriptional regulator [Dyadobacter sp. CECT 9275]CAG5012985.1 hypothetical protein DYBT9275_05306 [Dyadobacter sp. CECT 9275]